MKKNFRITILLCIGLLVIVGVVFLAVMRPPRNEGAGKSLQMKVHSIERIRAVGEEVAYREMVSAAQTLTPQEQHFQAHVFGEALYEERGIKTALVCDESYSFGCFHSFFGRAVAESGLEIFKKISVLCEENAALAMNCSVQLGHAVVTYLGYEPPDLSRALDMCHEHLAGNALNACTEGARDEFMNRTMLAEYAQYERIPSAAQ